VYGHDTDPAADGGAGGSLLGYLFRAAEVRFERFERGECTAAETKEHKESLIPGGQISLHPEPLIYSGFLLSKNHMPGVWSKGRL